MLCASDQAAKLAELKSENQVVKFKCFTLDVTDRGVIGFSGDGSFIDDPIAHFVAWSEFLWQEYEGCYFAPETNQYIYSE